MEINRVADITLGWGESVVWDDRADRLYFVDCATSALHWLEGGATFDADGGLWCALVGGGQLARFTAAGLDRTVPLPVENPTDVTFGGPDLDRLYVVSIDGPGELDGALLTIDGLGVSGRPEPRARIEGQQRRP